MIPVRVRGDAAPLEATGDVVEVVVRGALLRVRLGQDPTYIAELAAALAARC